MGALTSKPYAFQGRPWELKSVVSYDILDSNVTPIRIDYEVNKLCDCCTRFCLIEWITNKTRFAIVLLVIPFNCF